MIKGKKTSFDSYGNKANDNNTVSLVTSYYYRFKPFFKINRVTKNSPAIKIGLQKNDVLIQLNGKKAHQYKLSDIVLLFQSKHHKKIRIIIESGGVKIKFKFRLEKKI